MNTSSEAGVSRGVWSSAPVGVGGAVLVCASVLWGGPDLHVSSASTCRPSVVRFPPTTIAAPAVRCTRSAGRPDAHARRRRRDGRTSDRDRRRLRERRRTFTAAALEMAAAAAAKPAARAPQPQPNLQGAPVPAPAAQAAGVALGPRPDRSSRGTNESSKHGYVRRL